MITRSSSNLPVVSSNPSTSNPKRRNRRRSKQPFNLEESPIDTMADQRTIVELLRAPTEGYAEAIVVPSILAEQFELKHSLINMMTSDQTTNLRNEILNFQQRFDESFHQAWDRYKDLIRAYPHHGFTELHQLDTFYNALNPADQDSLNAATGGNLLERRTQDVLTIIENKSKMNTASTLRSGPLPSNTVANPKGKLKAITTRSGIVIDGPTVPAPSPFFNPEEDERVEETLTDPDLFEYTIKVPPPPVQKYKPPSQRDFVVHLRDPFHPNIPYTLRDVFVPVGKFTFLADFVIVDYESDPRVPLILGRPFLQTARTLIDVHGEEMILRDSDERLTLNMRHDTSSYSNQPQKESINIINVFNNSSEDFLEDLFSNQPSGNPTFSSHPELTLPEINIFDLEGGNVLPEKLLDLDSIKDLHPPLHDNPLSGSTTYFPSSNPLLKEFTDELSLITFPLKYDDDLYNLANLVDNFVDSMPEMFTDEHALDYSSPLIFDEYDDDFLEFEFDTKNIYYDPFDSKGEKIKESKLLIDELDLYFDLLSSEYDSFIFQDFSRVDAKPSTNNEFKVFNPGIFSQEKPFEIITRVVQEKKLATSNASLVLEDFDPPLYEPLFFKEVPSSKILLLFLTENEEKVFKPGIHIFEKVHFSFILELSHQGYKVYKINQNFKSLMKNFLFSCGKDTHILVVPCL
uniref:Reverse transcriptase domain-containing protein n=1 Tax=Tanacetum cinerariifolium TaxID=118510 RepID=A0A6L2JRF0_TANCI|nr:reverse transcriptase domain-containing protein [Tanacetum cinerariifolium]